MTAKEVLDIDETLRRANESNTAAGVAASSEPLPMQGVDAVATGSAPCAYCGGNCLPNDCVVVYTPITDCEHKDAVDGCCSHPKNMTPECHVDACPRLHSRLRRAYDQSGPNVPDEPRG